MSTKEALVPTETVGWLYDLSKRKEGYEVTLGDSLDVKASIALVVVAFLGATSGTILTVATLGFYSKLIQVVAIAATGGAGLCGFISLWPKIYWLEDFPQQYLNWAQGMASYHKEQFSHDMLLRKDMHEVEVRITKNHTLNVAKSWWLFGAFAFLGLAIVAEIISLFLLTGLPQTLFIELREVMRPS